MPPESLDLTRFYCDENLLGMARTLEFAGLSIRHPGDGRSPTIRLGAADTDWMPVVARLKLMVLTRDRRIRTRPAERQVLLGSGLRVIWFGGKKDLRPREQSQLFLRSLPQLNALADELGPGPWGLSLTQSGIRPLFP